MRNGKRLIAYYLPAFYPIPENDKNWGHGFTEWDNVRSAKPIYDGHTLRCFPHEDVGYYDMNLETLRKQQAMAKQYGLDGWCIYHYWFMGHEPYTRTLDLIMENPDLDLPFCVMWANESWSRTWDGKEDEILLLLENSREDYIAYIRRLIPMLADKRYIRVDGRPLVMLFKPLDEFSWVQEMWRSECVAAGLPEPLLIHKTIDGRGEKFYEPVKLLDGWDAAFEFPPRGQVCPFLNDFPKDNFGVMDYRHAMAQSALRDTDKRIFRTVMPSWDNSPRKGGNYSFLYHNSSPELFASWLEMVTTQTPEDIVFINAWNEWGESAVLEPSTSVGYANLEALTAEAKVIDLSKSMDDLRGTRLHWQGDEHYHAGRMDEARRCWQDASNLGNKQARENLKVLMNEPDRIAIC